MVSTCHVTGVVISPDGDPVPRATVRFQRLPHEVFVEDDKTGIPREVRAEADEEGAIAVDLIPGEYKAIIIARGYNQYPAFNVGVPDQPTAVLADIQDVPPPPSLDDATRAVRDAREARDESREARDEAAASAQAAANSATAAAGSASAASASASNADDAKQAAEAAAQTATEKAGEASDSADLATAATALGYGVSVYHANGVAWGGYYAERSAAEATVQSRVYIEIIDGDPGSEVTMALEVNDTEVYGPIVVTYGTAHSEDGLEIAVPVGASVTWVISATSGAVREVYARSYGRIA